MSLVSRLVGSDDGLPEVAIDPDTAMDALANARRRAVIRHVADADGPVALGDLADDLAEAEYGAGYDRDDRKRVYVGLYQTHVPRLDDMGVVAVENGTRISKTRHTDAVAELADAVHGACGGDQR